MHAVVRDSHTRPCWYVLCRRWDRCAGGWDDARELTGDRVCEPERLFDHRSLQHVSSVGVQEVCKKVREIEDRRERGGGGEEYKVGQVLDRLVRETSLGIAGNSSELQLHDTLDIWIRKNMVCSKGQCDRGSFSPGSEEDDGFVDELLVRGDDVALC